MTLTSKDGLTKVLTITNRMIYEKWPKLTDSVKQQVWPWQFLIEATWTQMYGISSPLSRSYGLLESSLELQRKEQTALSTR